MRRTWHPVAHIMTDRERHVLRSDYTCVIQTLSPQPLVPTLHMPTYMGQITHVSQHRGRSIHLTLAFGGCGLGIDIINHLLRQNAHPGCTPEEVAGIKFRTIQVCIIPISKERERQREREEKVAGISVAYHPSVSHDKKRREK
jgi:hypothetical protein